MNVLAELTAVLAERRSADPDSSYVAALYAKGLNKILEKVGEEATEAILAAKDCAAPDAQSANRAALVGETADLWFHTMVMLVHLEVDPKEVLDELERRFGLSGHAEKAARPKD